MMFNPGLAFVRVENQREILGASLCVIIDYISQRGTYHCAS